MVSIGTHNRRVKQMRLVGNRFADALFKRSSLHSNCKHNFEKRFLLIVATTRYDRSMRINETNRNCGSLAEID